LGRNKAGKAVLTLPKGAAPLVPVRVNDPQHDRLVAVTNRGYLLCFPVADLPQLPKGKGNKIIGIPPKAQDERLAALLCLAPNANVVIHSGKRHLTLKPEELAAYNGLRGRRGKLLPRGLQRVELLSI